MSKLGPEIEEYLNILYEGEKRELAERLLTDVCEVWTAKAENREDKPLSGRLSERDCILIAYGDSLWEEKKAPLQTLNEFLEEYCGEAITNVHLLPVFPYTSDDGFSVQDYEKIDPKLGGWQDIRELGRKRGVMLDAVVNHTSRSHRWFQRCVEGEMPYAEYYIEGDPEADYSKVTRPRTSPLLTEVETVNGKKWYWTTFSDDQMDLNFQSPYLLKEVLEVLLLYAENGARFIRLDAIGFIWKKPGTTCMHLKETHTVVKLLRRVLEKIYPGTYMITETNVPHEENISYFGNGDEAQLVYQFPLPPLVLYTMLSQSAEKLTKWADSLKNTPLPEGTAFFNFLASHDGIGVRPIDGILNEQEKERLFQMVEEKGGRISYKKNEDGSKSPYELNINYLSAVTDPDETDPERKAACFLASQAIMLSLQGVPGIYYHSLLGSQNWEQGVRESGINRRINREKLNRQELKEELASPDSLRRRVFEGYCHMLEVRKRQKAFSPFAKQTILNYGPELFALIRENDQRICVLINVTDHVAAIPSDAGIVGRDLLKGKEKEKVESVLPYQVLWLEL